MEESQAAKAQTDADNLRAEYSALSGYFNTVVTFRFTTLGFYLAAVALICGGETPSKSKAFVLFVISVSLYLVELRNRTLYKNLSDRGIQIECECWGYNGGKSYEPFFSHMMRPEPSPTKNLSKDSMPPPDYPKVFGIALPFEVTHSFALDILFTSKHFYFTLCSLPNVPALRGLTRVPADWQKAPAAEP